MIRIEMTGDRELVARLGALPAQLRAGVARAVAQLGFELQAKVRGEKLSGQVLKVRTGALSSSIGARTEDDGTQISAIVGTSLGYGRYHEYGVGHSWTIRPKSARVLAFEVGGKTIFARRVTHPPLPERSFLRSALAEMPGRVEEVLGEAVAQAAR